MTTTKLAIPIQDLYAAINSKIVLNAQNVLSNAPQLINDKYDYDLTESIMRTINEAIKHIESARKNVTMPLDAYKKSLIEIEKESTQLFNDFINSRKKMLLEYNEQLIKKQEEANRKIKEEANNMLKQSGAEALADIMGHFTDKLVNANIELEKPKNIRTIIKAKINGEVDWIKVIGVLFNAKILQPEDLLKQLPKAMDECGVKSIDGIELYEHKTQVIR
jgi:hypothetical protein